jgi:signal transduction histidine kinase
VERDLTHELALSEQLRHSQTMEAVGRLAERVAHDFANKLLIVVNAADLVRPHLPEESSGREFLETIVEAADQASQVAGELLAFTHEHRFAKIPTDVNSILRGMGKILDVTLGRRAELSLRLCPQPLPIEADPSQIEQAVLQLAVNAVDAMPEGGQLYVETERQALADVEYAQHLPALPGFDGSATEFAVLTVRDTGCGMPDDVRAHAFEPFFTTKGEGRSSGLGLCTVYTIVKQHRGEIMLTTAPGKGTTFTIYLPIVEPER